MIPAKTIHKIVIHSPVEASCGAVLAGLVKPCISFPTSFWVQGPFKKTRKESMKSMLTKGKGGTYYFWSGLLETILEYCADKGIEVSVDDQSQEELTIYEPELPGITFRPDQSSLINTFLDKPRGILESFTGSGKTVLGFGCLSSFPDYKVLWLCHTKGLMLQAYDEARRFGFKSVGRVGDGFSECTKDITIATRQSFKKLADQYGHLYDIVVVDEVHHVADLKSEYAYVLARVLAPVRLGLSATLHKEGTEAWYTAVGLIGPVLRTMSINDGAELGILATPTIRILRCPKDFEVSSLKKYAEVYYQGVVNNLYLNNLIAVTAKKHSDANETVLIMINQIEHGENIKNCLDALHVKNIFIRGATKSEIREDTKHALNKHEINVVICSSVWTEGVNIPTLQVVINAGGGKDEKAVLQKVGRGLRKTAEKDSVYIYDVFNISHRYLIEHFGERLCIYLDNAWL